MIENPKYGWCTINLRLFKYVFPYGASYLEDYPYTFSKTLIDAYNGKEANATIDSEGNGFFSLIVSQEEIKIIEGYGDCTEDRLLFIQEIEKSDIIKLCIELEEDIRNFYYEWSIWNSPIDEEEKSEQIKYLNKILEELEEIILIGEKENNE